MVVAAKVVIVLVLPPRVTVDTEVTVVVGVVGDRQLHAEVIWTGLVYGEKALGLATARFTLPSL